MIFYPCKIFAIWIQSFLYKHLDTCDRNKKVEITIGDGLRLQLRVHNLWKNLGSDPWFEHFLVAFPQYFLLKDAGPCRYFFSKDVVLGDALL